MCVVPNLSRIQRVKPFGVGEGGGVLLVRVAPLVSACEEEVVFAG